VQKEIKTRSSAQIRSHAQKYVIRLCRKYSIVTNNKKPYLPHGEINPQKLKIPQKSIHEMEEDERKILEIFRIISKDYIVNVQNSDQVQPRERIIKKKVSQVEGSQKQNASPKSKKFNKSLRPIFKIEKTSENPNFDTEKLKDQLAELYNLNDKIYSSLLDSPSNEETLISMISNNGNFSNTFQNEDLASQEIIEIKLLGTLQVGNFLDSMNKIYDQWSTLKSVDFCEEEMKLLKEIGAPL
jgi:hypothetical protein